MEALFTIGQRVVALSSHPQGCFKEGDEFTVLDMKQICCYMCIQITTEKRPGMGLSCTCGRVVPSDTFYFNQIDFAPIQEMGDMTFEEAIELVTVKELI